MPGWLQGSYTLASLPAAVQRSLNLMPEVNEIPVEKSVGWMRGTPGLSTLLLTLPTSPVRGVLAAGTPLYPQNGSGGRMFAVAGSKLYEVFASVVTTTGTSVAWVGGSLFYRGMKGQSITINGVVYTVATYVSTVSITLTGTAGNQTSVAAGSIAGVLNYAGTVDTSGTTVTKASGTNFFPGMEGQRIKINNVFYTVSSVTSSTVLVLTSTAGVQSGVASLGVFNGIGGQDRGDVGNDSLPVDLIPNGTQLGIRSNGQFYCDNGSGAVQPLLAATQGGCDTYSKTGTVSCAAGAVTWVSGDYFDGLVIGDLIKINTVAYTVALPGTPNFISYTDLVIDAASLFKITSAAHPFSSIDIGAQITITGGANFTVQTVTVLSVTGVIATCNVAVGTLLGAPNGIGTAPHIKSLILTTSVTTGTVAYTAYGAVLNSAINDLFPVLSVDGLNGPNRIAIAGASYVVSNIPQTNPDGTVTRVNLTADPTRQPNVAWLVTALNAMVATDGGTPNTTLTWISGDLFPIYGLVGATVYLDGFGGAGTVSAVLSATSLQVSFVTGPNTSVAFGINPLLVASTATFLDSFFIISPPSSKIIQVSAPNDGTSWDAADAAVKESYPDNIGKLLADHEECFVLGEARSEVWRAPGADPNFPFQRDPGACMSMGISAPDSAGVALQGICWIGGDTRGQPVAYYAQGFVPQRISTHAVEQVWASYSTVADAAGFVYELDGHVLWQIGFPTADATWVYDFTASAQMGKPMWHERNSWNGSAFHRHRASCHCYVFGKHWVGDFENGKIYEMDSDLYTDAGQMITCIRTLPHLCEERLREFFSKLQLDLETGGATLTTFTATLSAVGTTTLTDSGAAFLPAMVGNRVDITGKGAYRIVAYLTAGTVTVDRALGTYSGASGTTGVALTITVEWSDDGGTTFVGGGAEFTYTASTTKKLDRADFWRMGYAEQGDRVYRITVTGNARKALVNCYLDSTVGIS